MPDARSHVTEAYRLLAEGESQLEAAFDQVEAALRLEPNHVEALVLKARMLDHVQHHMEAYLCLTRAVELDDSNLDAVLELARNAELREAYEEAWEQLKRAGAILTDLEAADGEPAEDDWVALTRRKVNCLLTWAEAADTDARMAAELREHAGKIVSDLRQRFPHSSAMAMLHGELLERHPGNAPASPAATMPAAATRPSVPEPDELSDDLLERLAEIAFERCAERPPAHDAAHVMRVTGLARQIAEHEGARVDVTVAAALLHELFNHPKDHPDSHRSGEICAQEAAEILQAEGCPAALIGPITEAIRVHGFSQGIVPDSLEAKVLQDADRLDAIGAIGLARLFATCTEMNRPFYHPEDPFCAEREPDDKQWGLDHVYRKLLRIPERLHTATAKAMAEERLAFVEAFLAQLAREIG